MRRARPRWWSTAGPALALAQTQRQLDRMPLWLPGSAPKAPTVVSRQSQTQECATVTVSLLLRCGPDGGRGLQVRTHCTPRPPSYTQTGWVGGSKKKESGKRRLLEPPVAGAGKAEAPPDAPFPLALRTPHLVRVRVS